MDVREQNRLAWDKEVEAEGVWSRAVGAEVVEAARRGRWEVSLTPNRPVPREWFPPLEGLDVLGLASGGGQQVPILAAAGAKVTVLDNSAKQLAQDTRVGEREALDIRAVQGDMADLSVFPDRSFDLIFHPCSNCFVDDVRPVWAEAFRVLRSGGVLLSGFFNPVFYLFDRKLDDEGVLQVRFALPYSDLTSLSEEERRQIIDEVDVVEFGHTLTDQIGGQLDAGFLISGFYEDHWTDQATTLNKFTPTFIATRALKP